MYTNIHAYIYMIYYSIPYFHKVQEELKKNIFWIQIETNFEYKENEIGIVKFIMIYI